MLINVEIPVTAAEIPYPAHDQHMAAKVAVDLINLHDVTSTGKEIGCGAYGRVLKVEHHITIPYATTMALLEHPQSEEVHSIAKINFLTRNAIFHSWITQSLGNVFVYYVTSATFRPPVVVMKSMQRSLWSLLHQNTIDLRWSRPWSKVPPW